MSGILVVGAQQFRDDTRELLGQKWTVNTCEYNGARAGSEFFGPELVLVEVGEAHAKNAYKVMDQLGNRPILAIIGPDQSRKLRTNTIRHTSDYLFQPVARQITSAVFTMLAPASAAAS